MWEPALSVRLYTQMALNCNPICSELRFGMNFELRNDVASMAVSTYRSPDGTATSGQSKAQAATGVSSTQEGCPESDPERTFQIEDEKAASAGGRIAGRF